MQSDQLKVNENHISMKFFLLGQSVWSAASYLSSDPWHNSGRATDGKKKDLESVHKSEES